MTEMNGYLGKIMRQAVALSTAFQMVLLSPVPVHADQVDVVTLNEADVFMHGKQVTDGEGTWVLPEQEEEVTEQDAAAAEEESHIPERVTIITTAEEAPARQEEDPPEPEKQEAVIQENTDGQKVSVSEEEPAEEDAVVQIAAVETETVTNDVALNNDNAIQSIIETSVVTLEEIEGDNPTIESEEKKDEDTIGDIAPVNIEDIEIGVPTESNETPEGAKTDDTSSLLEEGTELEDGFDGRPEGLLDPDQAMGGVSETDINGDSMDAKEDEEAAHPEEINGGTVLNQEDQEREQSVIASLANTLVETTEILGDLLPFVGSDQNDIEIGVPNQSSETPEGVKPDDTSTTFEEGTELENDLSGRPTGSLDASDTMGGSNETDADDNSIIDIKDLELLGAAAAGTTTLVTEPEPTVIVTESEPPAAIEPTDEEDLTLITHTLGSVKQAPPTPEPTPIEHKDINGDDHVNVTDLEIKPKDVLRQVYPWEIQPKVEEPELIPVPPQPVVDSEDDQTNADDLVHQVFAESNDAQPANPDINGDGRVEGIENAPVELPAPMQEEPRENQAPQFSLPGEPIQGAEGSSISFNLQDFVHDPEGDAVTFEMKNRFHKKGMELDETGFFSWTPGYDQAGHYDVGFKGQAGEHDFSFEVPLTVGNTHLNPVIADTALPVLKEGRQTRFSLPITLDPAAHEPEIDVRIKNAAGEVLEADLSWKFDHGVAKIEVEPDYTWVGPQQGGGFTLELTIDDGTVSVDHSLSIEVKNTPVKPVIEHIPTIVRFAGIAGEDFFYIEDKQIKLEGKANDPHSSRLTFEVVNAPVETPAAEPTPVVPAETPAPPAETPILREEAPAADPAPVVVPVETPAAPQDPILREETPTAESTPVVPVVTPTPAPTVIEPPVAKVEDGNLVLDTTEIRTRDIQIIGTDEWGNQAKIETKVSVLDPLRPSIDTTNIGTRRAKINIEIDLPEATEVENLRIDQVWVDLGDKMEKVEKTWMEGNQLKATVEVNNLTPGTSYRAQAFVVAKVGQNMEVAFKSESESFTTNSLPPPPQPRVFAPLPQASGTKPGGPPQRRREPEVAKSSNESGLLSDSLANRTVAVLINNGDQGRDSVSAERKRSSAENFESFTEKVLTRRKIRQALREKAQAARRAS